MVQRRSIILSAVMLIAECAIGYVLRPVIEPTLPTAAGPRSAPVPTATAGPRGTQYFAANLDEARRIIANCRQSLVLGECSAHAQKAVDTAESRMRTTIFLGRGPR